MSITGSILTASSALSAFGNSISVVGDNIDNLNTVGFKTSRFQFADLLPTTQGVVETGHGARLEAVSKPFQQGALETTPNVTDLAVEGNGFFIVKDPSGTSYYTRADQFQLDSSGKLVNPSGFALQGSSGDITVGTAATAPGQLSSALALSLNLDASAAAPGLPFPLTTDASASAWSSASNFSSVQTIYDQQGQAHDLTFLFRKSGSNSWEYRVLARRNELDSSVPNSADLRQVATPGSLVFTPDGQLDAGSSNVTDISLNWLNGGTQTISANDLNFAGTVQYAQPSTLFSASQDGFAPGTFIGLTIDSQGDVTGRFSNGTTRVLGTITLANFADVDDLDPQGNTLFLPTSESGAAQTGLPSQGGFGSVVSGALEFSTVDLAQQFVSLITSQRAFQVNSRIITTADQMYADAANLKA